MAKPDAPQATPLSNDSYTSPLLAAMAALSAARAQKQQQQEWAGGVVQNAQGQYQYTNPQPGNESHFDLKLAFPKGDKLSALYHTHPAYNSQPSDTLFSPNDVQTADQLNVPSFIWVGRDGKNREYIPGQTPKQYDWNADGHVSKGTIVDPPPAPVQQVAQGQAQPSALAAALQSVNAQPQQQLVAANNAYAEVIGETRFLCDLIDMRFSEGSTEYDSESSKKRVILGGNQGSCKINEIET